MNTGVFSLSPGLYSSIVMKRLASEFWWALLLPVIVLLALGSILSSAWFFLIPILIFLLYPLLVMWAYYLTALSDEAVLSMTPHSLSDDGDGVRVRRYERKEREEDFFHRRQIITLFDEQEVRLVGERDFILPESELSEVEQTDRYIVYRLGKSRNRFLIVPHEAIIGRSTTFENQKNM